MNFGSSADPFNYPMPNRADCMSLSTMVASDGVRTNTKKFGTQRAGSNNLNTSDILGASPKQHGSKTVNKTDATLANWDIDRSGPRNLHMPLNKPNYNLNTNDIQGAAPNCVKFKSTRGGTDPLNPNYKIPQVAVKPPTPTAFLRDAMSHDDIEHSRPKGDRHAHIKTRDTNKTSDIAGCGVMSRTRTRKNSQGFDCMNYSDVTANVKRTNRVSNPLDPTYDVIDEDGKAYQIGVIPGSKSTEMPGPPKANRVSSLNTKDIPGAQSSTRGKGIFATVERRADQIGVITTKDIAGATADSLKKCPQTKRVTNPLGADYQYLGNKDMSDANNPYALTRKEQQEKTRREEALKQSNSALRKTGQQTLNAVQSHSFKDIPEHKQAKFKEDYAKFYGIDNNREANKIDYNKLYQASRDNKTGGPNGMDSISPAVKESVGFKANHSKFFGEAQSDSSSVYRDNAAKFYGAGQSNNGERVNPSNTLGEKFQNVQDQVVPANTNGELYHRNTAAFFGNEYETKSNGSVFKKNTNAFFGEEQRGVDWKIAAKSPVKAENGVNMNTGGWKKDQAAFMGAKYSDTESQGSNFQRNAAHFMGTETPGHGERPFKIEKVMPKKNLNGDQPAEGSYLNAQRLKEHEQNITRDPNFKKNQKRFFAVPSHHTVQRSNPRSQAEMLDGFINK